MKYIIKNEIDPNILSNFRKELGWLELPIEQYKKAINNSMINVSVYEEDTCIGIGRIVGDNHYKGMLTDIMIRPSHRGLGIGKLIVTTLIETVKKKLEEGEIFMLEASPTANNRDFYLKCGLKYKPEIQDGVYLWIKK